MKMCVPWATTLSITMSCLSLAAGADKAATSIGTASDITFNRYIASIIFQHCAPCHRPGESAPFELLSYNQVKKHGRQIVEVTQRHYMPPWPPESGYGEFVGERRLSEPEIALIAKWVATGMREGNPT